LIKYNEALDKALDKALTKHATKQQRSTHQSTDSIDKQYNKETIEPLNQENEQISEIKKSIEFLCNGKSEKVFASFERWRDYLTKQHNVTMQENEYTYQNLETHLKKFGVDGFMEAVESSIIKNYKTLWKPKEEKDSYIPPHKKLIL
jgi:hypothetical protein